MLKVINMLRRGKNMMYKITKPKRDLDIICYLTRAYYIFNFNEINVPIYIPNYTMPYKSNIKIARCTTYTGQIEKCCIFFTFYF